MVELLGEIHCARNKVSILHHPRAMYFKILLVVTTLISRFIHPYLVLAIILLNTPILVYYGLKKTLLYIAIAWTTLSSIIIGLDILLGSFKLDYLYNLLYGYASFTSILLFFSTTTPREIRRLIGFNVLSISYLFLDYSYRVLTDTLHSLQARGLTPSRNLSWVKYLLRSIIVILVIRINEVEEALRARGVD